MRRFGEPVNPERYYKTRIGVYAIITQGNQVLLTKQADPGPEIQLPGGGVDPGEGVLPALHREVMEETGSRISKPRRLGAYQRYTYMPDYNLWARKVCVIFHAFSVRQVSNPTEPGHTAIWTDVVQAPFLLSNEGDSAFLVRWAAGQV